MTPREEQLCAVREILKNGDKIEAIKRYREATGCGLKEAKEAVERLEHGAAVSEQPELGSINPDLLQLLRRGEKIEAIKRYRQATGSGLKEAKEAVEALAEAEGVTIPKSGCMAMLLLGLLPVGLALRILVE